MNGHCLHSFRAFVAMLITVGCVLGLTRESAFGKDSVDITPYIDEGTFLVGRLDLARVDTAALGEYITKTADTYLKATGVPAQHQESVKESMLQSSDKVKTWIAEMTDGGATHVYMVLDTADVMAADSSGPTIVIPIVEGNDGQKLIDYYTQNSNSRMKAAVIGKAIVAGSGTAIDRLTKRLEPAVAPVNRPDVAAALAAAGDAPLRIALVPSESARAFVEQSLPQIPEAIGGGETEILSRGVRYATIAVSQKPAMVSKMTVRATDGDAAKALAELMNKAKAYAEQNVAGLADNEELTEQLTAIQPKGDGDIISVNVDPLMMLSGVRFAQPRRSGPAPAAQPGKADDGGL